jgi:hypothetical protein
MARSRRPESDPERDDPNSTLEDVSEYGSTMTLELKLAAPTPEAAERRLAYIRSSLQVGLSRLAAAGYLEEGTATFSDPERLRDLPPRKPLD